MRTALRRRRRYTAIGIPVAKLGFVLGFQSGRAGGRRAPAVQRVVRVREAVHARGERVAANSVSHGLDLGVGTFNAAAPTRQAGGRLRLPLDARPELCDAPSAVGTAFQQSLTEGQIALPPGVQCSLDGKTMQQTDSPG